MRYTPVGWLDGTGPRTYPGLLHMDEGLEDAQGARVVRPEFFGAVGDGTTNDSAGLQAAINDVHAYGGILELGPKTYRASGLSIPPNGNNKRFTIQGQGWTSQIQQYGATSSVFILNGTADSLEGRVVDLTLRDFWIAGNWTEDTNPNHHAIDAIHAHNIRFDRLRIVGMSGDGIRFSGSGYHDVVHNCLLEGNTGIGVNDTVGGALTSLVLDKSRFDANSGGGVVVSSGNFRITNCLMDGNTLFGLYVRGPADGLVMGCHVEQYDTNNPLVKVGSSGENFYPHVSIIECNINGNHVNPANVRPNGRGLLIERGWQCSVLGGTFNGNVHHIEATAEADYLTVLETRMISGENPNIYNNVSTFEKVAESFALHKSHMRLVPRAQTISAAPNAILANAGRVALTNSSGGSLTLTSAPTIADGQDGQSVVLTNVGAQNIVLQDQGTFANSNLRLSASGVTLTPRDSLELTFFASVGDWVQTGSLVSVI